MQLFFAILSLLILFLAASSLLIMLYTGLRYVPFVPTPKAVVKKMIVAAKLKNGQKVYDLGCGDGRFLLEALKDKNIDAIGIEGSYWISLLARFRAFLQGKNIRIQCQDFFAANLEEADIIFCYLFPRIMKRLETKFKNELKPGTKVLSYCFPLLSFKPVQILQTQPTKPKNFLIYVYQF